MPRPLPLSSSRLEHPGWQVPLELARVALVPLALAKAGSSPTAPVAPGFTFVLASADCTTIAEPGTLAGLLATSRSEINRSYTPDSFK